MKRLLLSIVLLGYVAGCYAQQEQQFTQYMINPFTINPALGGTEDFTDIKVGYRKQWVHIEDSPQTYYATAHTTLGKEFHTNGYHHRGEHQSWHGIGGYVYGDQSGAISRNSFYGQYAFNMPLNRSIRLSIGTFLGLQQYSYDLSGLKREDLIDSSIPVDRLVNLVPDLSLGFWLYSSNWYIGGAVSQLFNNDINIVSQGDLNRARLVPHSFITGGVKLLASEELAVVPSFAFKASSLTSMSLDLNIKLDYNDQYFGGLSYRSEDAFAIIAGAVINKTLEISYSYDITTSSLKTVSNGSHEFILGVRLKHSKHVLCASNFW